MATLDEILANQQKKNAQTRTGGSGDGGSWTDNIGGLLDTVKEAPGGLYNTAKGATGDIKNLIAGVAAIPKGVVNKVGGPDWLGDFAGQAGLRVLGPAGAAASIGTEISDRDKGGLSGLQDQILTNDPNKSFLSNAVAKHEKFLPTITAAEQSVGHTGQRLGGTAAALGTGGRYGDNAYLNAFKQGDLGKVLLEDIGNVAAAGELGGGVLGRGAQAATRAETAAQIAAGDFSRLPPPPVGATAAAQAAAQAAEGANPFAHLPPPPVEQAAAAARTPFVPAPDTGFIGRTLGGHAEGLRAASDAIGSGTDFANKIAGAPLNIPIAAAGKTLEAASKTKLLGDLAQTVKTGVENYGIARNTQGAKVAEASSAGHGFANDVGEAGTWLDENLSPVEQEAVIASRGPWSKPEVLAQDAAIRSAGPAGQQSLISDPAWQGAPRPEVMDVLHQVNEARNAVKPTQEQRDLLSRFEEGSTKVDEIQKVQDAREASGVGRSTPFDAETVRQQVEGNAPIESWVQDRLNNDPQYQSAKAIVDAHDNAGQGTLPVDTPEVAKAREDLARLESSAVEARPPGLAEHQAAEGTITPDEAAQSSALYNDVVAPNQPKVEPLPVTEAPRHPSDPPSATFTGTVAGSPLEQALPGSETRVIRSPNQMDPAGGESIAVEVHSAEHPNDNPVGSFSWDPKTGEIDTVVTHPGLRGQGIAAALYDTAARVADEMGVKAPVHSANLTDEGAGFAGALGKKDVARAQEQLKARIDEAGAKAPDEVQAAQAKLAEREKWAREHPQSAPADWRDAIQHSRDGKAAGHALADELEKSGAPADVVAELRRTSDALPVTIDQMLDAGWERPGHVYGGKEREIGTRSYTSKSPRMKKTGGEYERTGEVTDYTPRKFFGEALARHNEQNLNEAIRSGINEYAQERPPVLSDIMDQTSDVGTVVKEMKRQGFEPVSPTTLKRVKTENVDLAGGDTVWVPKGVFAGFEGAANDVAKAGNEALRLYDKSIGAYKTLLLPLNPRWNVGNIGGNTILAAAAPTVRLRDIFDPTLWKETFNRVRNPDESQAGVLKRGPAQAALGEPLNDTSLLSGGKVRQGYRRVVQGAYNINNHVDDFSHMFVYTAGDLRSHARIAELEKLKAEGSITPEQFDKFSKPPSRVRGGGDKPYTPEQLVHIANNYVGDFTNLSVFERNTVKRLAIFYPWVRHMTQLAFRLPVQNPYRVIWTMKLADLYKDDDSSTPDWLKGAVPLGGGNFLKSSLNPFTGAVGEDSPAFSPAQALSSLTPAIQLPLASYNITGRGTVNPNQDKPGFIGLKSLGGYLLNQTPISRTIADTIQGPNARYADRSTVLSKGRPIPNDVLGGRWAAPANYLTGFSVAQPDLQAEAAKKRKKEIAARKKSR